MTISVVFLLLQRYVENEINEQSVCRALPLKIVAITVTRDSSYRLVILIVVLHEAKHEALCNVFLGVIDVCVNCVPLFYRYYDE